MAALAALTGLTAPVARADTVTPVRGRVTVQRAGGPALLVTRATPLPSGATLDTTHGVAEVSVPADHHRTRRTVRVSGGAATVRAVTVQGTTFTLPAACGPPDALTLSAGDGRFLVQGVEGESAARYARPGRTSTWTTTERCGTTTVSVRTGEAGVVDFELDRTQTLTAGRHYDARASAAVYPLRWSAPQTLRGSVQDVACATPSFCAAALYDDAVAISTDPAGGASTWAATSIPGFQPSTLACPSTTLCVALDSGTGQVAVSTDPAGGTPAWSVATIAGQFALDHLTCPATTLCLTFGDGAYVTTAPATNAWTEVTPVQGTNVPGAAACAPGGTLCVSFGLEDMWTTTNPAHSSAPWRTIPTVLAPNAVACPTSTECVILSDTGVASVSTDPAGPPGGYRPGREIDPRVNRGLFREALACPAADRCVAVAGQHMISGDPLTGDWTSFVGDTVGNLDEVTCPSVSECVAVDDQHHLFVGRAP